MKKFAIWIIMLSIVFTMTGCNDADSVKEVKNIVYNEYDGAITPLAEIFHEDDNYIYRFSTPISDAVIVEYSDGSEQNVKDALEDGNIVITDLDTYEIEYSAEPKHIARIDDPTIRGEYEPVSEPEEIYRDNKYIYYLPTTKSDSMTVIFMDETRDNLKTALADGRIRITDLEYDNIDYYKVPVDKMLRCDDSSEWNRAKRDLLKDNSLRMGEHEGGTYTDNCVLVWATQEITFDTSEVVSAVWYMNDSYEENRYEYYIQYETVAAAKEAIKELGNMENIIIVRIGEK